jgi:hypothetical protein
MTLIDRIRRPSLARRLFLAGVLAHEAGVPRADAPFEGGSFNHCWTAGWDRAAFIASRHEQAQPFASPAGSPDPGPRIPAQRSGPWT